MRLIVAAALLLTLGCAAATRTPLSTRTSGLRVAFTVVTWNVHEGRGNLPALIDDLQSGRLTGLPTSDYVILLQETIEGRWFDAMAIAESRKLFSVFDIVRPTSRGISGNAILSTRPLTGITAIDLPRERRVRKALMANLDVEGQRMFVVSTHFENRLSWSRGAAYLTSGGARERQAIALLQSIPDGIGFVGGDLNTWMGDREPALRALRGRFGDTPSEPLAPTFWSGLVLDHLFFDLPDMWKAAIQVVSNRYGSDHHPLAALILATGPPSVRHDMHEDVDTERIAGR